jgi:hypothetical protein
MTIATEFNFTSAVAAFDTNIKLMNGQKKALDDAAAAKKKEIEEQRKQLWFFVQVAKLANRSNFCQWYNGDRHGERHGDKTLWSQYRYFRSVDLDLTIGIMERSDLKRDKYVVKVHGTGIQPSVGNWEITEYKDYHYVRDTYGKTYDLEKKFRTLEAAQAAVKEWEELFIADHAESINRQLEIASSLTPEQKQYASERKYV